MNKIPVLIAQGSNSVQVPCRLFNTNLEEAKIICDDLFGFEGKPYKESGYNYYIENYENVIILDEYTSGSTLINKASLNSYKTNPEYRNVKVIPVEVVNYKASIGKRSYYYFGRDRTKLTDDDIILISYETQKKTNVGNTIGDKIFTHYYDGCGGAYSYFLTEIEFNSKIVGFDLD